MIFPMTTILPLGLLVRPALDDPHPLVIYHGRNCPDGFAAALVVVETKPPGVVHTADVDHYV
jgi:hypothetical protein